MSPRIANEPRWWRRRFASFDTETTGVDVRSDRIVSAAVVLVSGGEPTVRHTWLLDPGVEIPAAASAVHGITTARARAEGRKPAEVIPEIIRRIADVWATGAPIVAFNAPFDLTILRCEAERHGALFLPIGPVVDPLVIDRKIDPYRKGRRNLGAACEHHGVKLDGAHDAAFDALAAARIAWVLCERNEQIGRLSPDELHRMQAGWRGEQTESLELFLRRKDEKATVSRGWPIQEGAAR
jgi:DNA polymerase-3 subunit epsilon